MASIGSTLRQAGRQLGRRRPDRRAVARGGHHRRRARTRRRGLLSSTQATKSIIRVDLATQQRVKVVVKAGDGAGKGIGEPWQMTLGGPDLLILDRDGDAVALAPVGRQGPGHAGQAAPRRRARPSATTSATRRPTPANADSGLYFYYVVDPSSKQILRYPPTADGSGYPATRPTTWPRRRDVAAFRGLLIDGDVYALTQRRRDALPERSGGRLRARAAARRRRRPTRPRLPTVRHRPRSGARAASGSGTASTTRIVAMDKSSGDYLEQFLARRAGAPLDDVRGMFVVDRDRGRPAARARSGPTPAACWPARWSMPPALPRRPSPSTHRHRRQPRADQDAEADQEAPKP